MRSRTMIAVLILTQLSWCGWAGAALYPQPPAASPFKLIGFIQAMTLEAEGVAGDPLAGGTVTVNGNTVVIPRNTIVLMPGTFLSWQELWDQAPPPWGLSSKGRNGQTGLAMSDSFTNPSTGQVTTPLTTYEIIIVGNRIVDEADGADKYVAGLVSLSQQSLNIGQGVINCIDYSKGELHAGGVMGNCNTGARIRINDPVGRFGLPQSADPRFTADTDNPTIHAQTGYPMCIPRAIPPVAVLPGLTPPAETDPLCPQRNRPLDPAAPTMPLGNFTLGPVANAPPPVAGVVNAEARAVPAGDPNQQAPFMVGDWIAYSGALTQDPQVPGLAGQYTSAWSINAMLGIYTSPGASPAYMFIESSVIGVGGNTITAPVPVPQEVTKLINFVGYFTDPTQTVDLFAIKMDPCTGAETELPLVRGIPQEPAKIPWGRFSGVDQFGLFPITREWVARYTGKNPVPAANGLQSQKYRLPVGEYVTAVPAVFGDPAVRFLPVNFQDFPFLVNGSGPWRGIDTNIVGQLRPFPLTNTIPGMTPPAPGPPSLCGPAGINPPLAIVASGNQTVVVGATVTLNASGSTDPQGQPLTFSWIQQAGLPVTLTGGNTSLATFTAPPVLVNTVLTFQVTVTNASSLSDSTIATVEVTPPPTIPGITADHAAPGTVNTPITFTANLTGGLAPYETKWWVFDGT
ncbi:MAG TPA: hypothetical protein VLH58_01160, partial [Candidatus Methylomirabilis sp.]|nr:hypothetical protein [Candidatus Methylomirabilis sp.]